MGRYIHPATKVVENGRKIPLPSSWQEAQEQLSGDQYLAAVADRSHGMVALLIAHEADLNHVRQAGGDIYIISADLASLAS